jgi:polysaccharide export outer membrane protein
VYIPDASDTSVFVLGAVDHPGVFRLTPQMSFMDALGQAGGLNKEGNSHNIHLIRPNEKVNMQIDMDDLLEPQPALNVAIKEGDIIFVPRHNVSKVSYILQQINPFTFLFAIAQFGLIP